ncbi:GNAT family N-acetyltransferase [Rhizobium mongolense]|uniref:GNAT family N-acetyltransferase n=1 Tax=Rhizobium mongolense TaxID=57676 RepID=UPI0034A5CFBD
MGKRPLLNHPRPTGHDHICRAGRRYACCIRYADHHTQSHAQRCFIRSCRNVITHADHRRKGYAGALIRHACATAWEENCYKVMLLTGSRNPATLRFYENCGFMRDKIGYQIRRPG